MAKFKHIKVAFIVLMILFTTSIPVFASNQNIIEREHTNITTNQIVSNVVVVGNNATIEGTVKEAVIILNGNLNIKKTAHIQGLVVVLGGEIRQEYGATVTDDVLNIAFHREILNSLILGIAIIIVFWLLNFGLSILMILFIGLTVLLAKKNLEPIHTQIKDSPRRLILIGIATSIFLTAASVLLTITVIGIPLVVMLLAVILISIIITLATLSNMIGHHLLRTHDDNWKVTLTGALPLIAGFNFPFFGGILLLLIIWLSLGILTQWFSDWVKNLRKNKKQTKKED